MDLCNETWQGYCTYEFTGALSEYKRPMWVQDNLNPSMGTDGCCGRESWFSSVMQLMKDCTYSSR